MITSYLEFLCERGGGRSSGRKPSPTFAWELVNKKPYSGWRPGRYPGNVEERKWKGVTIDAQLKNKWLEDLNNIPNVEIRGSCCGHDKDWLAYVAFRISPDMEDAKKINDVVKKLNSNKGVIAGSDIGMEGRPRFVITGHIFYEEGGENKNWSDWWSKIAKIINRAVNQ